MFLILGADDYLAVLLYASAILFAIHGAPLFGTFSNEEFVLESITFFRFHRFPIFAYARALRHSGYTRQKPDNRSEGYPGCRGDRGYLRFGGWRVREEVTHIYPDYEAVLMVRAKYFVLYGSRYGVLPVRNGVAEGDNSE